MKTAAYIHCLVRSISERSWSCAAQMTEQTRGSRNKSNPFNNGCDYTMNHMEVE